MKAKEDYQFYCCGDCLQEGNQLLLKHKVVCNDNEDLSLASNGLEQLEMMKQESMEKERELYEAVLQVVKQWEEQAVVTQKIGKVLEYLNVPEVTHTGNQWVAREGYGFSEEISNRVYKMFYHIYEETKLDQATKVHKVVAWRVSWCLMINSPFVRHYVVIASQSKKRFTEKVAALKYLEGRKKTYAKLFAEISPVVPEQYQDCFRLHGMLLPGYTIENEKV